MVSQVVRCELTSVDVVGELLSWGGRVDARPRV